MVITLFYLTRNFISSITFFEQMVVPQMAELFMVE